MGTVVLQLTAVAQTMLTARNRQATTVALMGLARIHMSVATPVSARQPVVSAVPTAHTARWAISAAATAAQPKPIYAALMGQRVVRVTYASRIRSTAGTTAARIPPARRM